MVHQPSMTSSYQATVPTREQAHALADDLAARGHALVAIREVDWARKDPTSFWYGKPTMRPHEQGHYDVTSLDTGPHPDDDERWWRAQEDQAVRELAARHGGRCPGGAVGHAETMLRTFLRTGLVHELDDSTVRTRRAAAFENTPSRATPTQQAEQPPAGVADTDAPDRPGDPIHLPGVTATDWGTLQHAYGPADDVLAMLTGLARNDDHWPQHLDGLLGSVTHQGSSYSATAPTVHLLATLAAAPQLAPKRRIDLLTTLFLAGAAHEIATAYDYPPDNHAADVADAVATDTPALLNLWDTATRPERRLLLLLAALHPQAAREHDLSSHDLADPASRLAGAAARDQDDAAALLTELAASNEDLIELDRASTPTHARVVAALEVLLLEG